MGHGDTTARRLDSFKLSLRKKLVACCEAFFPAIESLSRLSETVHGEIAKPDLEELLDQIFVYEIKGIVEFVNTNYCTYTPCKIELTDMPSKFRQGVSIPDSIKSVECAIDIVDRFLDEYPSKQLGRYFEAKIQAMPEVECSSAAKSIACSFWLNSVREINQYSPRRTKTAISFFKWFQWYGGASEYGEPEKCADIADALSVIARDSALATLETACTEFKDHIKSNGREFVGNDRTVFTSRGMTVKAYKEKLEFSFPIEIAETIIAFIKCNYEAELKPLSSLAA